MLDDHKSGLQTAAVLSAAAVGSARTPCGSRWPTWHPAGGGKRDHTPHHTRGTSLHPVVVIAAATLAGAAFGVLGSIIAVPTAVVIMVLIEELWFRRVEEAASDHLQDPGS